MRIEETRLTSKTNLFFQVLIRRPKDEIFDFVYDVVIFSRDRVQEAEKVLTETES